MSKTIIVDTGPIVAYLHKNDRWHSRAKKFFQNYRGNLITTWAVITEAAYLSEQQVAFPNLMKWIERGLTVHCQYPEDAIFMMRYQRKYANRDPDFADLTLIALAEKTKVRDIITIDKDFAIYRLSSGKALNNIF